MEKSHYPFLVLTTSERFPRLLITRRPDLIAKQDTLYGAFLPETMVRRLIDFIARVFRPHPCELDIDGSFDAPCPEYFLHRCQAPCVASICDDQKYQKIIEAVHLLLSNRGAELLSRLDQEIQTQAENLEFERAAETHNARQSVSEILSDTKWQIRAEDFTDVLTTRVENETEAHIHLNTLRRGKSVGGKHFVYRIGASDEIRSEGDAVKFFIKDFYKYYLPKKIYVSRDFSGRRQLEKDLSERFAAQKRKAEIIAGTPPEKLPPSIFATQRRAEILLDNSRIRKMRDADQIAAEMQQIFALKNAPRRIECFDVAHLAGKEIVAARVVGRDGKTMRDEEIVWHFENLSETEAMAESVRERLKLLPAKRVELPDLILLDGGKAQLNAVKKVLREFALENLPLIAAVKPPKRHGKISHFLFGSGGAEKIAFDARSDAMNFLQKLRDEAHDLSNSTHREIHALTQIFQKYSASELPRVQLLLVPVRYEMRGGQAGNLAPIRSLSQSGEILFKSKKNQPANEKMHKRRSRFGRGAE